MRVLRIPHLVGRADLAGLTFVLLAHVGLNVALDTVKPEWRDPEFGHRLKRLAELNRGRGGRPLVVALGSSRTQMGFSPAHLDVETRPLSSVVHNMGQAGAGPLLQLLNLQRLLAAGIRPDAVLVEVMPPTLMKNGPAEHVLFPHVSRLGYADLNWLAPYCDDPAVLRRDWRKVRVLPWHSLRFFLMSHFLPGFLPWNRRVDFQWRMLDEHGWSAYPFDPVPEDVRESGTLAARKSYEETLADFRVAPLMDRALRDLIRLCQAEGIRVALYLLPEGPTFRSWYPPRTRAALAAYLGELSREFGVPVFDASGWLPDESLFADSHHLLKPGAQAFSRRFGAECLGPWLRRE